MLLRVAFTSPRTLAFFAPATRAMSAWAGSLSFETPSEFPLHRSADRSSPEEADSQPTVSGRATSVFGGLFSARDGGGREGASFSELPDVSKPEGTRSVWEGYRLMAVPKRKVSPSRNGLRFQHKWLKPAHGLIKCKGCGKVTVRHRFCNCGLIPQSEAEAPQNEAAS
ncbi:mitochondrial ribosomal protein L32 precursor [Klebsormidium nitens]|uniref:Large ribosomal subunit protein bL32m n=1 Tax=Klebsormidium nitens TaxID=105231 RepID=A0A1Y1HUI6_KLENI|nr:mitochondrial ribosomal protein L32 precursor [Klebsormidium nitens]|eukprot:GAQ80839.1 mitochondrial ribosomal protein L32 precursor [Klebsormidium nitens]